MKEERNFILRKSLKSKSFSCASNFYLYSFFALQIFKWRVKCPFFEKYLLQNLHSLPGVNSMSKSNCISKHLVFLYMFLYAFSNCYYYQIL